MESIESFTESLGEIDVLLEYAKRNTKAREKYQMFNKVAIILLVTKFEVFMECFFDEHLTRQINHLTKNTFPEQMRFAYLESAISKMNEFGQKTDKKDKVAKALSNLYKGKNEPLADIRSIAPSTNFPNGKHGQKDIERLFFNHGLKSFIERADVAALFKQINSCIGIRNSVIHQDAAPSLTHQDVETHKVTMVEFANKLAADVDANKTVYYNER